MSQSFRLRSLIGLCLVALAGCAPPGGRRDGRSNPTPTADSPVAKAARQAVIDYPHVAAEAWQKAADKSGEFKSWKEAWDFVSAEQGRAFAEFDRAIDAATGVGGKDVPYDAAKLREAALEAAKGFRAASGD